MAEVARVPSRKRHRPPLEEKASGIEVSYLNLYFKDPEAESMYLAAKLQASLKSFRFMWILLNVVFIYNQFTTHMSGFDYQNLPAGAIVIFTAQIMLCLFFCQLFGFLWKRGSYFRPEITEAMLTYGTPISLFVLLGPSNFWRVGVVVHGDGEYLWKVRGHQQVHVSDQGMVAGFVCVTTSTLKLPIVRSGKMWPHLLVTLMIFVVLTWPPGISPEPFEDVIVSTLILCLFYGVMWTSQRRHELQDRIAWERKWQLEKESQALREAKEKRRLLEQKEDRERQEKELVMALESAVEEADDQKIAAARESLQEVEWTTEYLDRQVLEIRKKQSDVRGVKLSYILSDEFGDLATNSTDLDDPTFYDMKHPFFIGPSAIGRETTCPRDGMKGCAFVDTLPVQHRAQSTHFLSWTWGLKLSVVRDALRRWANGAGLDPSEVSFYMCFFVNNQYRILVPSAAPGSENLDETFETNLTRIGSMVALLDTYEHPLYLTRAWTIFEQYVAMRLGVSVAVALPADARDALISEFERGKDGIMRVQRSMSIVDSATAKASDPRDEAKVKDLIVQNGGFKQVDDAIKRVFSAWVGSELRTHMDELLFLDIVGENDAPIADADTEIESMED